MSKNPTPPTRLTPPVARNPFGIRTGRIYPIARLPDPPPIPSPISWDPDVLTLTQTVSEFLSSERLEVNLSVTCAFKYLMASKLKAGRKRAKANQLFFQNRWPRSEHLNIRG
jgi:hypothetical protein